MSYQFTFGFFVTSDIGEPYEPEALEQIIDDVMAVMVERENELITDSGVGSILSEGYVDIDVAVNVDDDSAAGPLARDFVAEAIRESGGTPIGFLVFPPIEPDHSPQVWHERKSELTGA